jgi:hypothetical protein
MSEASPRAKGAVTEMASGAVPFLLLLLASQRPIQGYAAFGLNSMQQQITPGFGAFSSLSSGLVVNMAPEN